MGLLTGALTKAAANITAAGIGSIFQGIGSLAKDIRSAITGEPSPEKMAEINQKLIALEGSAMQGQMTVNQIEAAHPSVFVAGWRPFIGWVLGTSLALYFIPKHLIAAILWFRVSWKAISIYMVKLSAATSLDASSFLNVLPPYPVDARDVIELTASMLGLAIWRGMEKKWNVAR